MSGTESFSDTLGLSEGSWGRSDSHTESSSVPGKEGLLTVVTVPAHECCGPGDQRGEGLSGASSSCLKRKSHGSE